MVLADHHCHIIKQYYPNTLDYLNDLKKNSGLEYVCSMGLNYETNLELLELKKQFNDDFLKIGLGLHPSEVIDLGKNSLEEFEKIKKLILENKDHINFIGEIGMDFSYPHSHEFEKEQVEVFKNFCKLSQELDLPVSIHCRESWEEVINVLNQFENSKLKGFLHSFTGNFGQGIFCIEKGLKLGLNGIITFKKSEELRNTIKELLNFYSDRSFDDIFGIETDSPYLSPEPLRSKENKPENVKLIVEFIEKNIF